MFFEHQRQGHQRRDVGGAVRGTGANVSGRKMHLAHVRVDVGQAFGCDVDKAERQRCADPLVQIEAGEGDTELGQVEFKLTEGMGAVEDDIDAMLLRSGCNRLHRHHQARAMGDVGQGHQLQPRMPCEGFPIGIEQAVEGGRVCVFDLDHFNAAITRQPAHGAFDRVVFQIANQYLIAGLQPVVVADQRLQTFRGVTGQGDAVGGYANQPGQLRADLQAVALFETLAHVHRIAAVDQLDVALVFLDHRARHACEVTVLQVERAGFDIVAVGKGLPEGFITGAAGVVGHGVLGR
ncbi:hypothetical protein D3C85_1074950 [compost metagenome]